MCKYGYVPLGMENYRSRKIRVYRSQGRWPENARKQGLPLFSPLAHVARLRSFKCCDRRGYPNDVFNHQELRGVDLHHNNTTNALRSIQQLTCESTGDGAINEPLIHDLRISNRTTRHFWKTNCNYVSRPLKPGLQERHGIPPNLPKQYHMHVNE